MGEPPHITPHIYNVVGILLCMERNTDSEDETSDNHPSVTFTSTGIVRHLREQHGVQATTCVQSEDASTPSNTTATVAIQEVAHTHDNEWEEFLESQNMERVESIGRGLFAWERRD